MKIWACSRPWFWKFRSLSGKVDFAFDRNSYKGRVSVVQSKMNARILASFAWIGFKSLFWVALWLLVLLFVEGYERDYVSIIPELTPDDVAYNVEQLRVYAQLLTAIFSIYFATIGIILSAGYTRLRRDIIQMLTNEQVGSMYSRALVFSAVYCLAATALPLIGGEPGLLVYAVGTILTLLSVFALFPLGQRLFNFFDLNQLVHSTILPNIARYIESAGNPKNSTSLSNHHSRSAQLALEQLSYIDNRVKADRDGLADNLPLLNDDYTAVLLLYLKKKPAIDQDSYWFPRRSKHKQWFLASDSTTSIALQMSSQHLLVEEKPDYHWLEEDIVNRLAAHIELAFKVSDFNLALKLITRFSHRISPYATGFQFEVGMQELKRLKKLIEQAFLSITVTDAETKNLLFSIADAWTAMGSTLCLQMLDRIMTFEKELNQFFEADEWSYNSLRRLPAFLQVELTFVVERIKFEQDIEGRRLSRPKYIQQLAVQKLLRHYSKILPEICDFYLKMVPEFVTTLKKLNMSQAAAQVVLASLHSHWKLPRWFDDLGQLLSRYQEYEHYSEDLYSLNKINVVDMSEQFSSAREELIVMLGDGAMVGHIFEPEQNDELPDHFGQIYFELAEACISALEQNDAAKLGKVLPMFLILAFLAADSKFSDPAFDVNNEFRLHLISTVINDMASVLGFAVLYGEYFAQTKLSDDAIAKFEDWINKSTNRQEYFKRMLFFSNPQSFSMSMSPRSEIRFKWRGRFERRARNDGFGGQDGMRRGEPHPNKIVREFLWSHSDASHLFFAKYVLPQLAPVDFDIDRRITSLARRLHEKDEEKLYEDF